MSLNVVFLLPKAYNMVKFLKNLSSAVNMRFIWQKNQKTLNIGKKTKV